MEYLLLVFSKWAPDVEEWFQSLSSWHFLVAGGALLVIAAVAMR